MAETTKTLGRIAFDAAQDEWWGWDTYDDGEQKEDWTGDLSDLERAMWESGAMAVAKTIADRGALVIDPVALWAKIEEYRAKRAGYEVAKIARELRAMLGLDPMPAHHDPRENVATASTDRSP